jgi:hypothetical protein
MLINVTSGWSGRAWVVLAGLMLAGTGSPGQARADFTYTDGSFGVSINLPDNTSVSRVKNPAGESGTEIAQFTLPEGNIIGRLVVSDLPEKVTFEKAVADIREQLAKDTAAPADTVEMGKNPVQGNFKNAAIVESWDTEHNLLNGVLLVQGPSDQMLIMYAAMHNVPREEAGKRLKQLASGFTVLLSSEDEKRLQAAKVRGMESLLTVISPAPDAGDLWEAQYLLIGSGQEPYGYIMVREAIEERDKRSGLALQMERWVFWPGGGGAEYESQKAFASWDLHDDEWSSHAETVIESQGQPLQMIKSDQSVLRIGPSLMIETIDANSKNKPAKRVIPYPHTVVPQAWRWLLPRLLQASGGVGKPGEWMAMAMYSPQRRGMELQMFSRATHGAIRQVLQREGLYGMTENWQFEAGGKLKQISSTDMRLTPASEKDTTRLFAQRIAQWKAKVQGPGGGVGNAAQPATVKGSVSQPARNAPRATTSRPRMTGSGQPRPPRQK